MKLNIYCFNDILIYLEENLALDDRLNNEDKYEFKSIEPQTIYESSALTKRYCLSEIYYALLKLKEAALIETTCLGKDKIGQISDISWKGHQYIMNEIRVGYLPN